MDETDSGLDIDAIRKVAEVVAHMAGPEMGVLLITHYQRILDYIKPQFVHVMVNGRIFRSGGPELAKILEERGYSWVEQEAAATAS
jgi:Fe-S cluster assembly ATP-binding protein